jgi:hypothetical protein
MVILCMLGSEWDKVFVWMVWFVFVSMVWFVFGSD